MQDFLLDSTVQTWVRGLQRTLKLPVQLPQPLERNVAAWVEAPLSGSRILLAGDGSATPALRDALTALGADLTPHGHGRAAGIVVDATDVAGPDDLRLLHDALHEALNALETQGRVVVVGRPVDTAATPAEAAARRALEGFVRSLAKELGRRAGAAQLLEIQDGLDDWAATSLAFLLTKHSAFVSGQPVRLAKKSVRRSDKPDQAARRGALEGKVALITGAARGIGAETARALAAEGAKVVLLDRPQEASTLQGLAAQLGGLSLAIDVRDPVAPTEISHRLLELEGGVDIVVHNAGITRDRTLARMKQEHWDAVLDINLAAILRIDEALQAGALRPGGRLIYLSSVGGIAGNMGQTNYAATKAGLIGYVEALAKKTARQGITANAVAPGFIETEMTAKMPAMIRQAARRLCNLNQGGTPRDVAEAITFLALPGAQPISGRVLRVCGGSLLGA